MKKVRNIFQNLINMFASKIMKMATKHYLYLQPIKNPLPKATDTKTRLLYIHIPFCLTLCPYCSFHKFRFDSPTAKRYFELLHQEMKMVHTLGYQFDSIYFGGGTTTILPVELGETISLAKSLFTIREVSCESDPAHLIDLEDEHLKGKIDRLSIGIQSFNDTHLKQIGRYKKFGSSEEQFAKVKRAMPHFPIVNVDMIFNYPSQTKEELEQEIETILKLRPPQVTFYPLMYAPGIKERLTKKWGTLSDTNEATFYTIICERMSRVYKQRSAWAWSLEDEGIIDEYVIERSEYVGIGSGAFSFINDTLYANTFSLPKYAKTLTNNNLPTTHSITFPPRAIKQYRLMVALFGLKPPTNELFFESNLLKFSSVYSDGKVNQKGAYLASVMMREFYNGMDYIRETMRNQLTTEDGYIKPCDTIDSENFDK